jgi:hypothetical protein
MELLTTLRRVLRGRRKQDAETPKLEETPSEEPSETPGTEPSEASKQRPTDTPSTGPSEYS